MPEETVELFLDHGTAVPDRPTPTWRQPRQSFEAPRRVRASTLDDVAEVLEKEGVAAFAASFDDLIDKLQEKADAMKARK